MALAVWQAGRQAAAHAVQSSRSIRERERDPKVQKAKKVSKSPNFMSTSPEIHPTAVVIAVVSRGGRGDSPASNGVLRGS